MIPSFYYWVCNGILVVCVMLVITFDRPWWVGLIVLLLFVLAGIAGMGLAE
jgi:hypothetical protein